MNCQLCGKETKNPKFCSHSCAATYNNARIPKREPEGACKVCGVKLQTRFERCKKCRDELDSARSLSSTVGELKKIYKKHLLYARIRTLSRNLFPDKPPCSKCGYSKHVEICHIKAIKDFPDSATVAEINAIDNLIPLCPNCHWEFDNPR